MACRIIVSAPVPVPFLWTLDLGFGTWFGTWLWDLDLGLDLGLTIFRSFPHSSFFVNSNNCNLNASSRIFEWITATRETCLADEQGKCVRGRTDSVNEGSGDTDTVIDLGSATTQDLVEWLQQFKRPRY